jgi:Phospholipase_D-nuclease N-terminal
MSALAVLFMMGLVLALVALWIYALISAIINERLDSTMRLVWVIVIIFVNGLGAVLYLIIAPNRPTWAERARSDGQRRDADLPQRLARGPAVPPVLRDSGTPPA